jgi:hypothetical protein
MPVGNGSDSNISDPFCQVLSGYTPKQNREIYMYGFALL